MGTNGSYQTFTNSRWSIEPFSESLDRQSRDRRTLWSGRIATGLFGVTDCASGRRGPRSDKEVLIAPGNEGLEQLFYLGFTPCLRCTEQYRSEIFEELEEDIKIKYNLNKFADFFDKTILPFDARRLDWEHIANIAWGLPSRIYIPANLEITEAYKFANRLKNIQGSSLSTSIPPIGFYDTNSPAGFTEYRMK